MSYPPTLPRSVPRTSKPCNSCDHTGVIIRETYDSDPTKESTKGVTPATGYIVERCTVCNWFADDDAAANRLRMSHLTAITQWDPHPHDD